MRNHFTENRPGRTPAPPPDDAEPPVVEAVRSRSGTSLVVERCPYCHGRHSHGAVGPNFGDGDGHRVAHCYMGSGYVVREVRATEARTNTDNGARK